MATPAAMCRESFGLYKPEYGTQQSNPLLRLLTNFDSRIVSQTVGEMLDLITSLNSSDEVTSGEIPALDDDSISKSRRWISQQYDAAMDTDHHWINPLITANMEGDVVFEWWTEDRKLTVRIGPDGMEAIKRWGQPPLRNRAEITVWSDVERRKVWRWLTGNESTR